MSIPRINTDETAARRHLEKLQWPDGPICPHCGVIDQATKLKGKSTRPGVYKCRECEKPFSVTVGTVFRAIAYPAAQVVVCNGRGEVSRLISIGKRQSAVHRK